PVVVGKGVEHDVGQRAPVDDMRSPVVTGLGLVAEDTARGLVLQTVAGSVEYAAESDKGLAQLRGMVTSPGGTTAEALKIFETGNFPELVKQAVAAAYKRAKQLRS
ncbi:MAG: hypothetical protein MUO92_01650, partial [Dehalococcoidales bacterium]|nr:hypothetical protein [Dehalococcoidales bacterium]